MFDDTPAGPVAILYLSLNFPDQSDSAGKGHAPDPAAPKPEWGGMTCRGEVPIHPGDDPMDAGSNLCLGADRTVNVAPRDLGYPFSGLIARVPSLDARTKQWTNAEWLFAGRSEPDIHSLVCLDNCSVKLQRMTLAGSIGTRNWVRMELTRTEGTQTEYTGSYFYEKSQKPIAITASMKGSIFTAYEFADDPRQASAEFDGQRRGDTIVGTWHLLNGKRALPFYLGVQPY